MHNCTPAIQVLECPRVETPREPKASADPTPQAQGRAVSRLGCFKIGLFQDWRCPMTELFVATDRKGKP